jgi:hypothetical protein
MLFFVVVARQKKPIPRQHRAMNKGWLGANFAPTQRIGLNWAEPNVAKAPTFPAGANFSVGAKIHLKDFPQAFTRT